MTGTIKTYSDHFPWFIPGGNGSLQDIITPSSRFDINTEKPATLKEYLQTLPTDPVDNHQNYSSTTYPDSKVVVVARIGDYDNETGGEWVIIAEPKERNETLNFSNKNGFENSAENSDYFLGNDDVQKYLNDYQDLLYTFKDLAKIGVNLDLRKNLSHYNVPNENNEKVFNVSYVMPIPKTKKYFEIKLSNLTELQYIEINSLLQKHILRKTNSTDITKTEEKEIVYVDENNMSNNFISHALSNPSSSHGHTSKPELEKSRFTKELPRENHPTPDYFGPLLTPEGFNYFLNHFDSIHIDLNNKSVDQTVLQPNNSTPTLLQNNGFHAEIATDYIKKYEYDGDGENKEQNNSFSQKNNNSKELSGSHYQQLGSGRAILNPLPRRNRTRLFPQTRSKRPIMNAPDSVILTRKRKISPISVPISEGPIITDSSTFPPNHSKSTLTPNLNSINISSKTNLDNSLEITSMNTSQNIIDTNRGTIVPEINTTTSISAQDILETNKVFNSSLPTPDKIPKPFHVMEAAQWLIDMKQKIEDEERKKTERYKSYIKQFLGSDEDSILLGRGNDTNIMKINKQENILEELKLLMLEYFASLNIKAEEAFSSNTSSAVQSILNASNIFELMEQSSQLIKSNLQMKLQSEAQEPTKFVKQVVEKLVERCKKISFKGLFLGAKPKQPGSTQKRGYRRLTVFTKCMNTKLESCIKGFSLWLEKGKFFLRPQFKLDRAYENYEIKRNLYCLRNYNPSSLASHTHGVRVKPGSKVNRKSGLGKIGARQNKWRLGMRANKDNKNGHHNGKSARPNIERNRRYKQQKMSKQRLKVQRYLDHQGEGVTMQKN